MKIDAKELELVMASIIPAQEKTSVVPVMQNVLVHEGRATVTDIDVTIIVKVDLPESFCVNASQLYALVRKLDGELDLTVAKNYWLHIKSGKSVYKLTGVNPSSFAQITTLDTVPQATINGDVLKSMIRSTFFASELGISRYQLAGVQMEIDARATCVATDASRLSVAHGDATGKLTEFIPARACQALVRVLHGDVAISSDENNIQFTFDDSTVVARKVTGQFPNWRLMLLDDGLPESSISIAELKGAIDRAILTSSDDKQTQTAKLGLTAQDGELIVSSQHNNKGETKDVIGIDGNTDFDFRCQARFLQGFLATIEGTETVTFVWDGINKPVAFKTENRTYIIVPLRNKEKIDEVI